MKVMPETIVEVRDLCKIFGSFKAVDNISFSVETGEIYGFLGPNGAGKSTTIRMLCGLLTPSSGSGTVAGLDIMTQSEAIKEKIGYNILAKASNNNAYKIAIFICSQYIKIS